MVIKILYFHFCSVIAAFLAYGQTTYYVSSSGNDANNGTSPVTPWKTLFKIPKVMYSPGDSILLKRGDTFDGSKLSSGVYCTRFIATPKNGKQIVQVKKILLTK